MWYDILVLAILVIFTVRGAAKGMVWQLAGIAGIVLCFVFADAISALAGPYVNLEPPLNNWVVLFGAYVVFTLIAYLIAGQITEYLEKVKLKDFDRHLGAVFGFVKGVVLCLIMTFLIVTVSDEAREALKQSRSGIAAARIVKTLHPYLPILPEGLVNALESYIHLLDDEALQNHYADEHEHSGLSEFDGQTSLGETAETGQGAVLPQGEFGAQPATQLNRLLSEQTASMLLDAVNQAGDSQTRQQLIHKLLGDLQQLTPEQRAFTEQHLQELASQGSKTLLNHLAKNLGVALPSNSGSASSENATNQNSPAQLDERIAELRAKVVAAYTSDPQTRIGFESQIEQFLGMLPKRVYAGVLEDWHADIWSLTDPDPKTTGQSTLEQRILRQMELAGISIDQLAPAMQQRLRAAASPPAGSVR